MSIRRKLTGQEIKEKEKQIHLSFGLVRCHMLIPMGVSDQDKKVAITLIDCDNRHHLVLERPFSTDAYTFTAAAFIKDAGLIAGDVINIGAHLDGQTFAFSVVVAKTKQWRRKSLQDLAKELFTIQNAEDNEYPDGVEPSLEFVMTSTDITTTVAPATLLECNNEKGFS
ncbi:hypothetical protein C5167_000777 [Papaver somniferum]|uniref:Uncharacterized protein n=1 Tax=Papaver somniferum TaxID=3469 RepID=A0A4Y7KUV5_PAPSO|nr:hypothetical protein C5167_000777 [Papaver somniferum]